MLIRLLNLNLTLLGEKMLDLIRREEFLFPLETQLNKIFNNLINESNVKNFTKSSSGYPKMDAYENENELIIEFAVPGLDLNDINIEITKKDNVSELTISGKRWSDTELGNNTFHIKELKKSSFYRLVVLPNYANNEVDAVLKNGILTLKWKKPEKIKPQNKKIEIKQV